MFQGCFRSFFQQQVIATCGCADSRFPLPTDSNVTYCDDTITSQCGSILHAKLALDQQE